MSLLPAHEGQTSVWRRSWLTPLPSSSSSSPPPFTSARDHAHGVGLAVTRALPV